MEDPGNAFERADLVKAKESLEVDMALLKDRQNLFHLVNKYPNGWKTFSLRFTPTASRIWENIPYNIKTLPFPLFIKQYKRYLLDSQK